MVDPVKEPERELQRIVLNALSDPSESRVLSDGSTVQIFSPGRLNRNEGPDFLHCVICRNGRVIVGEAEFDRRSALWFTHGHDKNPAYRNVILHIVEGQDAITGLPTLVIGPEAIARARQQYHIAQQAPLSVGDELQTYSLVRLLRKSAEAMQEIRKLGIHHGFVSVVKDFLQRYASKRRRPTHKELELQEILNATPSSAPAYSLGIIAQGRQAPFAELFHALQAEPIASEGRQLRSEILLNSFVPTALGIGTDEGRVQIFQWYWSAKAIGRYSKLVHDFPDVAQKFLWQQQGLLEFVRERGALRHISSESIVVYGFAAHLDFLSIGLEQKEFSFRSDSADDSVEAYTNGGFDDFADEEIEGIDL